MRRLHLLLVLSLSVLPAAARAADASPQPAATAAAPGDAIVGRWKADEGGVVAAITANSGKYEGVVVTSPEKPALVGKPMFRGLVYDAAGAQWTGEVYAPKRDEFVPATLTLSKDGFVLKAGKGLMSKKMNWTKG
jgi:uncharacterized protein (DUF2147 family)